MSILRLLVADDHEIVRKGLCALLQEQPGWVVAGEAKDGYEAVKLAKQLKPDVSVIDISMPRLNGVEATRQIINDSPKAKVLVLTMHETDGLVRELLAVGAQGFLLKTDSGSDLVRAVKALQNNQTSFTPKVAGMLLDGFHRKPVWPEDRNTSRADRITPRQKEIIQLLGKGKTTKETAAILGLSVKTAETHRANIMRRLNCHSVTDLVRYAVRNQIIESC
jgi:DNA-binding NarL/FixJ family response regulator